MLPTARVFYRESTFEETGWYYQFESAAAVGPFAEPIEAGTAAREIILGKASETPSEGR